LLFDPTAADILERFKVLLYRKRGPMRGMKRKISKETSITGKERVAA
jgi:hypothetical protein